MAFKVLSCILCAVVSSAAAQTLTEQILEHFLGSQYYASPCVARGVALWGDGIRNLTVQSVEACQVACQAESECAAFIYGPIMEVPNTCQLVSRITYPMQMQPITSGPKYCKKANTTAAPINTTATPQETTAITTTAAPNTTTTSSTFAGVESMVNPAKAAEVVVDDYHRLFEVREDTAAPRVQLHAWQAARVAIGAVIVSFAMIAFLVRGNGFGDEGQQQPLISEEEKELESVE